MFKDILENLEFIIMHFDNKDIKDKYNGEIDNVISQVNSDIKVRIKEKLIQYDRDWGRWPENRYEGFAIFEDLFFSRELDMNGARENEWGKEVERMINEKDKGK